MPPDLTSAHSAVVLWDTDAADVQVIADLKADRSVSVIDQSDSICRQYESLLPTSTATTPERGHKLAWVYFPWRRTLTRLMGPEPHRNLRLDRNRNKITRAEQDRLGSLTIGVVGLSVGHAIAHTLALEGLCGALRLADFDTIELSNLNRIPASVLDIGINKAVVVARRIAELDPYLPVDVFPDGLTADNMDEFFAGLDLVVEECDSLDIKLTLRLEARRRGIPVLMETSDRGLFDVERFDLEPNRDLFHGLLGDIDPSSLKNLSTRDKAPHVMRILEAVDLSPRMAASMVEIDRTLNTWPQLGGDVQLGAATVAAAVRRFGRGDELPSGRIRIDIDDQLKTLADWQISPHLLFPEAPTTLAEEISGSATEAALQAIRLAPSGGNVQPWRVRETIDGVQIQLDPNRTSAMDIGFRGSYVSIGAATLNARIAFAAHGLRTAETFRAPTPENLLAASLAAVPGIDPELATLYPTMQQRISNRNSGRRLPISESVRLELSEAAKSEGGRLLLLTDPDQLAAIAEILAESDRLRYLTPLLHSQMMAELKWPGLDDLSFGIDVRTLGLDEADLAKLRVAERADVMAHLRAWGGGQALGDNTRDRVSASSAVAIITVTGDEAADYLRGGAAMQRVWITAQRHELAIAPISPVFLYARSEADLVRVSDIFASDLGRLQQSFTNLIDITPDESVVLVMRVTHEAGPTLRSRRLPTDQIMVAKAGPARANGTQEKLDRCR